MDPLFVSVNQKIKYFVKYFISIFCIFCIFIILDDSFRIYWLFGQNVQVWFFKICMQLWLYMFDYLMACEEFTHVLGYPNGGIVCVYIFYCRSFLCFFACSVWLELSVLNLLIQFPPPLPEDVYFFSLLWNVRNVKMVWVS